MSADSTAASALVWTWVAGNIGPISTIILMGVAMTKYIEKRNHERIEEVKKDILIHVDSKLDNLMKDIASMNQTYDLIRKYIESDVRDLKAELIVLKSKDMGSGSSSGGGSMDFRTRFEIEREREMRREQEMERASIDDTIEERKKRWDKAAMNKHNYDKKSDDEEEES